MEFEKHFFTKEIKLPPFFAGYTVTGDNRPYLKINEIFIPCTSINHKENQECKSKGLYIKTEKNLILFSQCFSFRKNFNSNIKQKLEGILVFDTLKKLVTQTNDYYCHNYENINFILIYHHKEHDNTDPFNYLDYNLMPFLNGYWGYFVDLNEFMFINPSKLVLSQTILNKNKQTEIIEKLFEKFNLHHRLQTHWSNWSNKSKTHDFSLNKNGEIRFSFKENYQFTLNFNLSLCKGNYYIYFNSQKIILVLDQNNDFLRISYKDKQCEIKIKKAKLYKLIDISIHGNKIRIESQEEIGIFQIQ